MSERQSQPPTGDLPKVGAPATRALNAAGIQRLEHLTHFTEADIKQLHGIGPNALNQLRRALTASGLAFAVDPIEQPGKIGGEA